MEYHTVRTFQDVLTQVKKYIHNQEDMDFILKAFDYASKKHFQQFRKSGEPFINHCIEVTYILATYQMSPTTLAAGLLHDVVEDCDVSLKELENEFGKDVASIVEAVTKIHRLPTVNLEESTAATHRKLILAMAKDVRAVIVKLADRLHNMRTLQFHSVEKQKKIAKETLEVYAPLSHRLGMNELKNELENLSFYYLDKDKYLEIKELIDKKLSSNEDGVDKIIKDIGKLLDDNQLSYKIFGRIKHIYSVYKKIYIKDIIFERIFDLQAIRIITDTKLQCYEILGLIHEKYVPIPGRFKDYIAMPKPNLYQSLHTTICDSDGNLFEIQIRTKEMDRVAENGVAAHWIYKESAGKDKAKDASKKQKLTREQFAWLVQLINMYEENPDTSDSEYIHQIQKDIFEANVYCLTPNGKIVDLPQGSTPIDFAYRIHSDVGNKMVGAIVNDSIVPLSYKLSSNDIVNIKTSNTAKPNQEWLNFVKTNHAKNKIKAYFSKQEKDKYIEKGRAILQSELRKKHFSFDEVLSQENIQKICKELKIDSLEEIYFSIGTLRYTVSYILGILSEEKKEDTLVAKILSNPKMNTTRSTKDSVLVHGKSGMLVNLARCCHPVIGDEIVGYVTKGEGVTVHKANCVNINMKSERLIPVSWNENSSQSYETILEVTCDSNKNYLLDILAKSSGKNIFVVSVKTSETHEWTLYDLSLKIDSLESLEQFINALYQYKFVKNVKRK